MTTHFFPLVDRNGAIFGGEEEENEEGFTISFADEKDMISFAGEKENKSVTDNMNVCQNELIRLRKEEKKAIKSMERIGNHENMMDDENQNLLENRTTCVDSTPEKVFSDLGHVVNEKKRPRSALSYENFIDDVREETFTKRSRILNRTEDPIIRDMWMDFHTFRKDLTKCEQEHGTLEKELSNAIVKQRSTEEELNYLRKENQTFRNINREQEKLLAEFAYRCPETSHPYDVVPGDTLETHDFSQYQSMDSFFAEQKRLSHSSGQEDGPLPLSQKTQSQSSLEKPRSSWKGDPKKFTVGHYIKTLHDTIRQWREVLKEKETDHRAISKSMVRTSESMAVKEQALSATLLECNRLRFMQIGTKKMAKDLKERQEEVSVLKQEYSFLKETAEKERLEKEEWKTKCEFHHKQNVSLKTMLSKDGRNQFLAETVQSALHLVKEYQNQIEGFKEFETGLNKYAHKLMEQGQLLLEESDPTHVGEIESGATEAGIQENLAFGNTQNPSVPNQINHEID